MIEWLAKVSEDDDHFADEPYFDNRVWRAGQKFLEYADIKSFMQKIRGEDAYIVPSEALLRMKVFPGCSAEENRNALAPWFTDFRLLLSSIRRVTGQRQTVAALPWDLANFLKLRNSFYIVRPLATQIGPYVFYSCTCPDYQHYLRCKHVIVVAVARGNMTFPQERLVTVIGSLPRRGRPRKAGLALSIE